MSELLHISTTLAKIIARINPKVWEVIGGGPLGKKYQLTAQLADPDPHPWLEAAQLAAVDLAQPPRRARSDAPAMRTRGAPPAIVAVGRRRLARRMRTPAREKRILG